MDSRLRGNDAWMIFITTKKGALNLKEGIHMLRINFRTILTGFIALLVSNCMNDPEQVFIEDPLNINRQLSAALKDECGMYIPMNFNITSTDEFHNYKLLILGEVDGHMDTRISTLGMNKTHEFLFKEVLFIYVSLRDDCFSKDSPCETEKDTLESRYYKTFIREFRTYRDEKTLNKLFKRSFLNSPDHIFLMTKSNAKKFSNGMKELIIE